MPLPSDSYHSFEISPHHSIQPPPPKRNYKRTILFVLFGLLMFALMITINVYEPVKLAIYDAGLQIKSIGWYGPFILVFINGCLVIPWGVPYVIFEMTLAMLISNFWFAWFLTVCSLGVGCSVVFYMAKNHLRKRVLAELKKKKFYRGLELMLKRNPFKFSVIIRLIFVPPIIKNYGLAVPEFIDFKTYILAAVLESMPRAALRIFIYQRAPNLGNLFSAEAETSEIIIAIVGILISFLCVGYVICYTKKVMRDMHEEAQELSDLSHLSESQRHRRSLDG